MTNYQVIIQIMPNSFELLQIIVKLTNQPLHQVFTIIQSNASNASQGASTMHTRNENHALDSRTSWLHCACKKREKKKEKEGAQAA